MTDIYDREKIIEILFDPVTSEILAELENEEKELSFLAKKSNISETEVKERLSYLIEHDFVNEKIKANQIFYSANAENLAKIMENDENFDSTIDGLTKMDSYLN